MRNTLLKTSNVERIFFYIICNYINTYGQVLEGYWFARIDNDWERLKIGNCFPTKQLATENVENFLAYIKGEPDFSWRKK